MQVLSITVAAWWLFQLTACCSPSIDRAAEPGSKVVWLGYEVRDWSAASIEKWSSGRRAVYLVSERVDRVLSVDCRVWPRWGMVAPGVDENRLAGAGALMSNPVEAERLFDQAIAVGSGGLVLVGFSVEIDPGSVFKTFGVQAALAPPEHLVPRLLGFDVADAALLSGLSNSGYAPGEMGEWASQVNSSHLLPGVREAAHFRAFTETRVPEHSPFYVFGIWLLKSS
jgi:hypothetical protein